MQGKKKLELYWQNDRNKVAGKSESKQLKIVPEQIFCTPVANLNKRRKKAAQNDHLNTQSQKGHSTPFRILLGNWLSPGVINKSCRATEIR